MRGELATALPQTSEVDNPLQAGVLCNLAELTCSPPILLIKGTR
jgi:hypothetical protein